MLVPYGELFELKIWICHGAKVCFFVGKRKKALPLTQIIECMEMIKQLKNNPFDEVEDGVGLVVPIISEFGEDDDFSAGVESMGSEIPILPMRNMTLFPGVALPVVIGRSRSMKLISDAVQNKGLIGVACQRDELEEYPTVEDLYTTGTVAEIMRVLEMPNGTSTVILQGRKRFDIVESVSDSPYLVAKVKLRDDIVPHSSDHEFGALVSNIKETSVKYLSASNEFSREMVFSINNNKNLMFLVNFACVNIPATVKERQDLIGIDDMRQRALKIYAILNREMQLYELKASIRIKTHEDLNNQQKEYFLQQQMKNIQEELNRCGGDSNGDGFKEKANAMKWSDEVKTVFESELKKLERLPQQSPDYSIQSQYIQTILSLPWDYCSKDKFNMKYAQKVLDREHFGLERVKDRILEHLAVLKLRGDMKSPIVCLYGPPGVGKTSLGKSIAAALNRKYVRVSLGGMHDEAEIRGHRRTYIGAMPGRILKSIQKAGTSNPVFVLDEVDKINSDFKGDPSSALLEVLDPEQNTTFHDNYLDIDYDLSKVMFIATANNLNGISQPLLDRMELIDVSGYILEEKIEIAARHLLPRQLEAHGIPKGMVRVSRKTLKVIIESYTRESGVRELDKKIAKLMRKLARRIAEHDAENEVEFNEVISVKPDDVKDILGAVEYTRDKYQGNSYAGVVTGLAWTAVGGEILFVETSLSKGKGGKLTLTGQLGDVMKESAMLALEYIHSHAAALGVDEEMFEKWNVHVHVPEGAIPKDGPSAGITMVTSLLSALTQRKVKSSLAMTGEITLRGKVLPVGGIREKILAAKRAGIKEIILCEENRKDIDEIKEGYIVGLEFHFVKDIMEVINIALLNEKVENPLF